MFHRENQQENLELKLEVFLKDLNSADERQHTANSGIDVIIRSNLYLQVVTGEIKRNNECDLEAINIAFGWFLQKLSKISNNNGNVGLVHSPHVMRISYEANENTILNELHKC